MVDLRLPKATPLVTALVLFALICLYSWSNLFVVLPKDQMWDRHQYLTMAEGHADVVVKPFTKRILHPLLAGFLSRSLDVPVRDSFFGLAFPLLAILIGSTIGILHKSSVPVWLAFPIIFSPYFSLIFSDFLMHDLLFSALAAFLFLLLVSGKHLAALGVLFLLFLTREATLLLSLLLVGLGLYRRRFVFAVMVAVVSVAGLWVVSRLSGHGLSNIHGLGEAPFMMAKFVYNFSANFLGVNLWVNTYHSCEPSVVWNVPPWMPAGMIRQAGFCSFDFLQPVHTFGRMFTIFGIGPGLAATLLVKRGRVFMRGADFWLLACLTFGLASFLLGPCLGPGGYRLMGYGSPAFALAGPVLLISFFCLSKRPAVEILVIHLVLTWLPFLTTDFRSRSLLFGPDAEKTILFLVGLTGQILAWRILKKSLLSHSAGSPAQSPS